VANTLYYGDNLDVLRQHIASESVDLVYLDPPFNSNATYNVLFKTHAGDESRAQIEAFDDTWHWGSQAEDEYRELTQGPAPVEVARFIEAMRTVLGTSDMLAYLAMMAPRLLELRRVMKSTASIYLHCDPTASHYLKLLMDAVFGGQCFRNEIVWHYQTFHGQVKRYWPKKHDTLLFYTKGPAWNFAQLFDTDVEDTIDGTRWKAYLTPESTIIGSNMPMQDTRFTRYYRRFVRQNGREPEEDDVVYDVKGQAVDTVWDLKAVDPKDKERLGYPTQKPIALLERIIRASCPDDGVILDPFCGCGTAVDAAQQLGRSWVGIDITYIAVDLIIKRLRHRYGDEITGTFTTNGIPTDIEGAAALFTRNPFDFERWAVSFVNGEPNEKQVGDRGVDGRIRFHRGGSVTGLAAVSVKGGHQLNPAMVHQLVGALQQERADMGVLVTMSKPTAGMVTTAHAAGTYEHAPTGNRYPRVQIITVPELFDGKRPNMPTVILPYIKAKARPQSEAVSLFDSDADQIDPGDE
jgi:DNA modification methylase